MTRSTRLAVFLIGGACVAALLSLSFLRMPAFGGSAHQYRDHAIGGSIQHGTANAVSSVNFDQRGIDTLGEESILLASVVGAAALLRPMRQEKEENDERVDEGDVLEATRLVGYLLLAVTVFLGIDVVTHGHVTPGGGFQGGVIIATGYHLLYVAGRYQALTRLRPLSPFEVGEGFGAAAFAGLGIAGVAVTGSFLGNVLPYGSFGDLLSAGSVPLFNVAVGLEVGSGTVVLLAKFLEQALTIEEGSVPEGGAAGVGAGA